MATRYLTTSEAAERLGLSHNTVHALTASGDLPCVRTAGGHRRFSEAHLAAYEARRTRAADAVHEASGRAGAWRKAALGVLRAAEKDLGAGAAGEPFRAAADLLERASVESTPAASSGGGGS
ncbi:MAG: helix-turn-helix domain-containing protein [Thermoleophilia bacterium]